MLTCARSGAVFFACEPGQWGISNAVQCDVQEVSRRADESENRVRELERRLCEAESQHSVERTRLEHRAGSLQDALTAARTGSDALQTELSGARQAHAAAAAELVAVREEEEGLREQLEEARAGAVAAVQAEDAARMASVELRARAEGAEAAARTAAVALENAVARAKRGEDVTARLAAAREEAGRERRRAVAAEEERAAAATEVATLEGAVAQAGEALLQVQAELVDLRRKWREFADSSRTRWAGAGTTASEAAAASELPTADVSDQVTLQANWGGSGANRRLHAVHACGSSGIMWDQEGCPDECGEDEEDRGPFSPPVLTAVGPVECVKTHGGVQGAPCGHPGEGGGQSVAVTTVQVRFRR